MRTLVAALLLSSPLVMVPTIASAQVATREVTRAEYRKVERGMSRTRVERVFGAGRGCQYVSYTIGDALFTGRQYRNTEGNTVSIRFVTRADGVARVRGKQWDTIWACN